MRGERQPGAGPLVDRVRLRMAGDDQVALAEAVRADARGGQRVVDDAVLDGWQREVRAELHGAGPLEPLLALPGVTDVLVNAPDEVWFERGGGLERAAVGFADEAAVRRLAQRLAASVGRRLDDAMPFVDGVLADGTRLHALLPPLARHTTVSLRVLGRRQLGLEELMAAGAFDEPVAELLQAVVAARAAFVVCGGTGTGKTTLLGAMLARASVGERLVVIEDAPELSLPHPHVVRLSTRTANVEGAGAVGLRELVRQALRMRPDRLVVGEFRGAEMVELLVAMNTGHEGSGATLHANSAADVPARFAALGALAGLPAAAVASLVASAVEVVIALRRDARGIRVVEAVGRLARLGDELVVQPVWQRGAGPTAGYAELLQALRARGA